MPENKKSYKIDNIIERSDKTQEILTYIPKWIIRSGITILAIIIVSFIVLSKFIKYPDVVTSVITLRSDNPPSLYFAKEDNRTYDFIVTNRQKVILGEALAIENNTDTLFSDIEGIIKISIPKEPLNAFAKDELVFNIIPEHYDRVFGTIKLNSNFSSSVKIGQKVNIQLYNFDHTNFGTLSGKISSITTLTEKDHNIDIIEIDLLNGLTTDQGNVLSFTYGMQGNADIITHDISAFDRIFEPFLSYFK